MLRTRRSASRLVSSSIWRIRRAASCLAWSSISWSSSCLARARRHAGETCSSARSSLAALVGESPRARARARPRGGRAPPRGARAQPLRSASPASCARRVEPPAELRGVAIHARTGRGRTRAMRTAVQERSDHDSHRDQRCGTDDVHGRSSPLAPGEPGPFTLIGYWERPSGPCGRTNGCRTATAPIRRTSAGS